MGKAMNDEHEDQLDLNHHVCISMGKAMNDEHEDQLDLNRQPSSPVASPHLSQLHRRDPLIEWLEWANRCSKSTVRIS